MKKIILLLLITFNLSFSQSNFKPAYYISNSGVKTEGFINDYKLEDNDSFYFKSDTNSEGTKISINDISELGINDIRYLSKIVDYDLEMAANLHTNKKPYIVQKRVLLEVLVEGDVSLYAAEITGTAFYYIKTSNNSDFIYLFYKTNTTYGIYEEDAKFKRQLFEHLKCGIDYNYSKFKNIGYYEDDIKKVVNQYNICKTGKTDDLTTKKVKEKVKLTVLGGMRMNRMRVVNPNFYGTFDTGGELSPTVGIEASYRLGLRSKSTELFLRASYDKIDYSDADRTPIVNSLTVIYEEIGFKSNLVHLNLGLRYYFSPINKSSIFAEASFEYLSLTSSESYYSVSTSSSSNSTKITLPTQSTICFDVSLGYLYNKKYAIALNCGFGGNFFGSDNFSSKASAFGLTLKYTVF